MIEDGVQNRLIRKMDEEFSRLQRWISRLSKQTILDYTMEYAAKKEILDTVRVYQIEENSSKALIRMNEPLDAVFQAYMCGLDRGQDAILNTINSMSSRRM